MNNIEELRELYRDKFDDNLPNMTIPKDYEKRCLKEEKDEFELGYFNLNNIC
ncbi:hypothetical protein [Parvimonas micra]|uniref:Uncharacterized protein n=1 Tax=Parvimonas micra ATCC 33270 TaxID=411465 RepID=A8SLJ0_9FIRM|nr:hypothetical protein [Parvimonas micra]EDP23215.1 hypothetical protein PEPMIC_01017 [Parvimonas micra ATCC 33270]RSB90651.1 serine/threonine protein phosphatase [Parvimonas micra]VEH97582.1 Uncharacterised protein [Parvimonas micra]